MLMGVLLKRTQIPVGQRAGVGESRKGCGHITERHGANAKGDLCVDCQSLRKIPGNLPCFISDRPTETFINRCNGPTKGAVTSHSTADFNHPDRFIPLHKHLQPGSISLALKGWKPRGSSHLLQTQKDTSEAEMLIQS